jgi:hypothetical protein
VLPVQLLAGQSVGWLQLLVTVTPHLLPQAVVLSGKQHVPPVQTSFIGHPAVPLTPQLTICPQLLVAWLHCMFPQATCVVSGTQLHAPFVQVPPSHPPQSSMLPQLSVVIPQRPVHQFAWGWHSQTFFALQTCPPGQTVAHVRIWLQLSGPVLQCVSHQARSAVHVVPASPSAPASEPAEESASVPPSGAEPPEDVLPLAPAEASAVPEAVAPEPTVDPLPDPLELEEPLEEPLLASPSGVPGSMPSSAPQAAWPNTMAARSSPSCTVAKLK